MKDNLEKRFKELHGQFDLEEPNIGHFNRFEAKLNRQQDQSKTIRWNPKSWKWLAVAASVTLLLTLFINTPTQEAGMQLAEVSPEMEETQSFFISTIQNELESINAQRTDENKEIIDNALAHLNILEEEYNQLTIELEHSEQDKRIIYAMVSNFQQRIEVLQTLLQQLEEINDIKSEFTQV
ncbi:MAG: hypothetical protein QNJ57_04285 [Flavobacteriaceae bacterium]|nr:hypothetical protein [Flavobacteriaceae bacterium]